MLLARHLAVLDRLLEHPGPRTVDLSVGEEFWEDDGTARQEAEEAFGTDCEALVVLCSERWGEPERVELEDHLVRRVTGEPVPEPLFTLCASVRVIHLWRTAGRWIAVGIGREGRELPLRLIAAVGDGEP